MEFIIRRTEKKRKRLSNKKQRNDAVRHLCWYVSGKAKENTIP